MVDTLWPANAVSGAPEFNARMRRQANSAVLPMGNPTRPLGGLSGVRSGTSTTTVTATSTTWTCGPFAGVADVMTASESGPYEFAFDANATGSVTVADASNPRVDIVYVQITDPEDGATAPVAVRGYLAGSAAVSPVPPATPARSFVIAQINVPKAGGGSPTVTWVATGVTPGNIQFQTKALLDLWTSAAPRQSATVINDATTGLNVQYVRTGSSWSPRTLSGSYHPAATATFYTINFPASFSAPPYVFAQIRSGAANSIAATILVTNITATSFQIRLALTSGSPDADVQLQWLAVSAV